MKPARWVGRRTRLAVVVAVVLLVGLSGCLDAGGVGDEVRYTDGSAAASSGPASTDPPTSGGTGPGADLDVAAGQATPTAASPGSPTPTGEPDGAPSTAAPATGSTDGGPTSTARPAGAATFVIVSTDDDAELSYEFTVDGSAERTVSEDGYAGDRSDEIVENEDGTTTIRGSTGFGSGDAFAVGGEITAFERTGGESDYVALVDGEDVTDALPTPEAGGTATEEGGGAGDGGTVEGTETAVADGTGADTPGEAVYGDSDYDVSHTRSISSNGDGTTTISGAVWNRNEGAIEDLVVVVEVYDADGRWLDSAWVALDPVTPERQSYSVTVDVPRDAIAEFRADVNGIQPHAGDAHYNAPGQCVEIDGDGPNDEEPETVDTAVVEFDPAGPSGGTVVVGSVQNGADEHDMAFVRVFVSIYDGSGTRLDTRSTLMEDLPQGETGRFAVSFEQRGVAEARVDADELAIKGGRLVCRPPL